MATILARLGEFSFRFRWTVIIAWLVLLVGAGTAASFGHGKFSDVLEIPGIPSNEATELSSEVFGDTGALSSHTEVRVVFRAPEGVALTDPQVMDSVDAVVERIRQIPQLGNTERLGNPVVMAGKQFDYQVEAAVKNGQPRDVAEIDARVLSPLSPDKRIGYAALELDVASPAGFTEEMRSDFVDAAEIGREAGLTVELGGSAYSDVGKVSSTSEIIGFGIAALVLLATFGSLVAAGIPLATALIGIAVISSAVTITASLMDLSSTTLVLAVMIGLATAIDYALFILARYRHELPLRGTRQEAAGIAVGTAGSAVIFAGMTVIIALAALSMTGIPFLASMGFAAAGSVVIAVLIALTLLPAMLGVFKGKAFAGRVPLINAPESESNGPTFGRTWVGWVRRRPLVFVIAGSALLGALAIPAVGLTLAVPTAATAPLDSSKRQAADILSEGFGPGVNSQFLMVVDARKSTPDTPGIAALTKLIDQTYPEKTTQEAAQKAVYVSVLDRIYTNLDVINAQIIRLSEAGDAAHIVVTPAGGAADDSTIQLLKSLRSQIPVVEADTGADLGITGQTAIEQDISQRLTSSLAPYLLVVVGLAMILLIVVFRSILVPLTATAGFLLSIAATFGVTVGFFSQGWFGLFTPAPLTSFMPIFLIGVVFGLAMDYQVFLVTRMREGFVHGMTPADAVVDGFSHGARVVTSAGLIMISVFAAFVAQEEVFVQSLGFALAAAVLFDAFIVRMTIIPGLMVLMGQNAWWMPQWLERIVPKVDVEGEKLTQSTPEASSGAADIDKGMTPLPV